MTIADQLTLLSSTKSQISAAIEARGVSVGSIPFSQYPSKIAAIPGGGGGGELQPLPPTLGSILATSPPAMSASSAALIDDDGGLLYKTTATGPDKVLGDWYSTRKILAAMVVWDEKQTVWESELVTVTGADINTYPTGEWSSGFTDGDQVTWKDIAGLMLVPSKSDVAATVTRVLGQHVINKYGVGADANQAIGYWMGMAGARAGAPNLIALTNNGSISGEYIATQLTSSKRTMALVMRRFVSDYPSLIALAQQRSVTVNVVGPNPKTLTFSSMDRLQSVLNSAGAEVDSGVPGYVVGKTGDNGDAGHQVFGADMPSGKKVFGVVRASTTRENRAHDVRRLLMAAENNFPHLRSPETVADPYAASVGLRIKAALPATDSSPSARSITSVGVTSEASAYMDGTALFFNSGYLQVDGGAPVLGGLDFTAEVFLRGAGLTQPATTDLFGQWRTVTGGRNWAFQLNDTEIIFWYSISGSDSYSVRFPISRTFLLNGSPTHIVAMRLGNSLVLFVNGQPSPVTNIGTTSFYGAATSSLMIGARVSSGGAVENYFNGLIDEAILTVGLARYPLTGFRSRYRTNRWG